VAGYSNSDTAHLKKDEERGSGVMMRRCDNLKKGAPIMARIDTASEIDWTQCELIEQVPGKVSGRPIVRGTRILPDAIVNS
jgi:hypothetical protein